MRTKTPIGCPSESVAIFVFAHQDDEFGVFYEIESAVEQNVRVICLYLTDGQYGGSNFEMRKRESVAVLENIGVPGADLHFLGQSLGIPDGKLVEHLDVALNATLELMGHFKEEISSIYIPAWEGGHQDHDAAHLVGLMLSKKLGLIRQTFQFSLYNGYRLPWLFFRVLSPLPNREQVTEKKIPWHKRFRYLRYCHSYSSQWKTWVALYPFIFLYMISIGKQKLQQVNLYDIYFQPHPGVVLYQRRNFCSWESFHRTAANFMSLISD